MKLYYTPAACSLIVRIILNELNIPASYEAVDLRSKKTETGEDFLAINPKGSVPALQLDDGEILTENAVIIQYIADTAQATALLPAVGDFNRYRVLEWLNYAATDMHKGLGLLFNPKITQTMKDEIFIPLIEAKLKFIDTHLQTHTYLLGDHFTLPDAYLFVILRWASYFQLPLNQWENITRYINTLNARPSIQRALEQEK